MAANGNKMVAISQDELARLQALAAKVESRQTLTLKVGDGAINEQYGKATQKGNIRLYGLQRMPISLWVNQWETVAKILDGTTKCKAFGSDKEVTFDEFVAMHSADLVRK